MLEYIRARVEGGCPKCKDGGNVEIVASSGNNSYIECIFCKLHLYLSRREATIRIRDATTDWVDNEAGNGKRKKKKKKVTPLPPVHKKKKKKKGLT